MQGDYYMRIKVSLRAFAFVVLVGAVGPAFADDAKPLYPAMAPIGQYRSASSAEEISLARSAAPKSISDDAAVLVLGEHGYVTAVKGKNDFTCMVERSWAVDFDDPQFWNPKLRAPNCFNSAATRTVLATYLERTKWVLAGVSLNDMLARTKSAIAAHTYRMPAPGAMCFMMSKQGYLNDAAGHWHPHVMVILAHTDDATWGADLDGSPVFAQQGHSEPITTFIIPVTEWSDGTPAAAEAH
jgi:hypothetical protein